MTKTAILRAVNRVLREGGPYALALTIFAVTAHYTLNTVAAHYADELFTLALVLMRNSRTPPAPPAP